MKRGPHWAELQVRTPRRLHVPLAVRPLAVRPLAVRPLAVRPLAARPLAVWVARQNEN